MRSRRSIWIIFGWEKLWTVQSIELLSCRPETRAALRVALVSPHQQGCWHSPNVCRESVQKMLPRTGRPRFARPWPTAVNSACDMLKSKGIPPSLVWIVFMDPQEVPTVHMNNTWIREIFPMKVTLDMWYYFVGHAEILTAYKISEDRQAYFCCIQTYISTCSSLFPMIAEC